MNIELIRIEPTNLDDIFYYKRLIEDNRKELDENGKIVRKKLDDFLYNDIKVGARAYSSINRTVVPYGYINMPSAQDVNEKTKLVFYVPSTDENVNNEFIDFMTRISWDINNLQIKTPVDIVSTGGLDSKGFVTYNNNLYLEKD